MYITRFISILTCYGRGVEWRGGKVRICYPEFAETFMSVTLCAGIAVF